MDTFNIFNSYYDLPVNLNSNEYELVRSYFKETSRSNEIAESFSMFFFKVAQASGKSPMELLQYMKTSPKIQVNNFLIYYLNSMKSKTALYGFSVKPTPNMSVQHNIVN